MVTGWMVAAAIMLAAFLGIALFSSRGPMMSRLVGFELTEPGIARHGHDVYRGDAKAGVVTSGTQTPFLKKAIERDPNNRYQTREAVV